MRVQFAYPYESADGKTYKQEQVVDLDEGLAADLIHQGIARKAAPTPAEVARAAKTEKES